MAAPPSRLQLTRIVRTLRTLLDKRREQPAVLVATALRLWCLRAYPKLKLARLSWCAELADAPAIQVFVGFLERLPFFDAAYWLSTTYAALSDDAYRKTFALYFTPPTIANRLIADLVRTGVNFGEDRFIDPACGGAAFLAILASGMRKALKRRGLSSARILAHAENNLTGIDVDPLLCALSRHFMQMVFYEEISSSSRHPRFSIVRADSLRTSRRFSGKFDVVVCNPPFRKLSSLEAKQLRPRFGEVMQAQPNLYSLFISLSARLVREGGLVGLVTPSSFLSGQYFSAVRTFLLKCTDPLHLGIVTRRTRVYFDVQQETALTVFRATHRSHRTATRTAVSVVDRGGEYRTVGRCQLPNSGASWPVARNETDFELIEAASRSPFRLKDYGYTPCIGGYVWTRDERPVFLTSHDVPTARRRTAVPLIWSSDIRQNGKLFFRSDNTAEDQHRFVDLGSLAHPSVWRRAGVMLQRVTSNDQPRRLVGAVITPQFLSKYGGFVGENHTVLLEQSAEAPAISARWLLQLLRAASIDRYFRCISGSTTVSAFDLTQLPLPDPAELRRQLATGVSIDQATERLLLGRKSRLSGKRGGI